MALQMRQYKIAFTLTVSFAAVIFVANLFIGTDNFFLLLNADSGIAADYFFHYYTYLGDGIFWVPVVLFTFFFKRDYLVLVIAAIVFSTLLTHLFKDLLLPGEARPTKAIGNLQLIHVVKGVELHSIGSFPSGHTTTAFCFYLLACLFFNKRWIVFLGFLLALLVGYSRIYLAQHFPRDVAGGMVAACLTMVISTFFYFLWQKNYKNVEKNNA
ncbi:MAG: hypothetical protein C0459_01935 [Chitinophaga sp.]|jgi:membrane-associated phospholipid phosphatase|nr:hypothetical protein [Chitinophaga sp.]